MPIDDNVFITGSRGETCLVCDRKIPEDEACIKVKFNVNVFVTKVEKTEAMHYSCAGQLYYLLGQRISEIQKLIGGRR